MNEFQGAGFYFLKEFKEQVIGRIFKELGREELLEALDEKASD